MKLKNKLLVVLMIVFAILLIVPSMVNAAAEETYEDQEQNIVWAYELDDANNSIINLKCTSTSVTGTVTIPSTIGGKTVVSIGNTKNTWNDGAFENCVGLTEVIIPNTVTTIGNRAFYNCPGLRTVTIPGAVTSIGSSAFSGCSGLKTVVIPDSVTSIGRFAFSDCSGITSITFSSKLTTIGEYAFENCSGLKTVTLPNSVTIVGQGAFKGCSGINGLTLSNSMTKISDKTFEGCTALRSVIIPESVTTLEGDYTDIYGAFGGCTNLQKVLIPDSVATIGTGAFRDCDNLTIYGNDDQESKTYAEANEIPFDYIANWDKADNEGQDVTPPTVEKIEVTKESVRDYTKDTNTNMYMVPAGAELVIKVYFNEVLEGTTAPTLTIKFGDGEEIDLTNGIILGSQITYTYTVKSTDKGVMTTKALSGGDMTDAVGNEATLSCPELTIEYDVLDDEYIYANGTNNGDGDEGAGDEGDGNTGDGGDGNTGDGGDGSGDKGDGNTGNTGGGSDGSQAPGSFPNAGKITTFSIFIIIALAGIISFTKVRKYRDIK